MKEGESERRKSESGARGEYIWRTKVTERAQQSKRERERERERERARERERERDSEKDRETPRNL